MTSKTVTAGGVPESHVFITDYLARITAYSGPDSSWQYIYAPTGDRIAKQHVGLGFEDDNQWDLNSDADVLASYHKSGVTEVFDSIYVSPGMDGRLARIDGTGTASYFMNDALNSVHQVTGVGGAFSGTNFTDAWGNAIDIGIPTPGGASARFGFTNRENDPESGLMYYRARAYDPVAGRFTSRDPFDAANLYSYADNNPVNRIDPMGSRDTKPEETELFKAVVTKVKERVKLEDDYAYHRKDSDKKIDEAIKEVEASIKELAKDDPDPPQLKALMWAFKQYTNDEISKTYSKDAKCPQQKGSIGAYGAGDWKCNKLVADAYAIGAGVGLSIGEKIHGKGEGKGYPAAKEGENVWGPQADDLAQLDYNLRSLSKARDLDEARTGTDKTAIARPGDIIAFPDPDPRYLGHSSLYVGNGLIISARKFAIEIGTLSSEKAKHGNTVRIRQFTGSGK